MPGPLGLDLELLSYKSLCFSNTWLSPTKLWCRKAWWKQKLRLEQFSFWCFKEEMLMITDHTKCWVAWWAETKRHVCMNIVLHPFNSINLKVKKQILGNLLLCGCVYSIINSFYFGKHERGKYIRWVVLKCQRCFSMIHPCTIYKYNLVRLG